MKSNIVIQKEKNQVIKICRNSKEFKKELYIYEKQPYFAPKLIDHNGTNTLRLEYIDGIHIIDLVQPDFSKLAFLFSELHGLETVKGKRICLKDSNPRNFLYCEELTKYYMLDFSEWEYDYPEADLIHFLLFSLLACSLLPNITQARTLSEQKGEAASYYDDGAYETAYKQYLKLAKDGDSFAQYRVSFMKLTGVGTKEKAAEALAWAVLASQSGDVELVKYRIMVTKMVPAGKRKSAERTATRYLRRWGPEVALDDSAPAGASRTECTASRLKRNCFSEVTKPSVHIAWGEDLSADPAQMNRVAELNQIIVKNFSGLQTQSEAN